jgi:hypothetical protein
MGHVDDKDHRLAAFRVGVDDYLPKPFEPEELVRRLERALGHSDVAPKPPSTSSSFDVQGRLENLSLGAVIRLLEGEGKTGSLRVHSPNVQIVFSLQAGVVVSARLGEGQEADVQRWLSTVHDWNVGGFWFSEQSPEAEPQSYVTGSGSPRARPRKRA